MYKYACPITTIEIVSVSKSTRNTIWKEKTVRITETNIVEFFWISQCFRSLASNNCFETKKRTNELALSVMIIITVCLSSIITIEICSVWVSVCVWPYIWMRHPFERKISVFQWITKAKREKRELSICSKPNKVNAKCLHPNSPDSREKPPTIRKNWALIDRDQVTRKMWWQCVHTCDQIAHCYDLQKYRESNSLCSEIQIFYYGELVHTGQFELISQQYLDKENQIFSNERYQSILTRWFSRQWSDKAVSWYRKTTE